MILTGLGISTLLLVYSFLLCYLLKIILIDDSDVTGFQGYRVSKFRPTPVDYPIITLLYCMNAITKEQKIKSCYFILEKVTRVHLEWGSYQIFMDIQNYFSFLYFRSENLFQLTNRNITKTQYIAINSLISLR